MAGPGGGKRFTGTWTTDGAGAAVVNLTLPARADGRARKLLRAALGNAGSAPMTGGTAILADNAGAGQTLLTFTQSTDGTKKETGPVGTALTGNLRITVASGGASKTGEYLVEVS